MFIAQAVANAAMVSIQAMAMAGTSRQDNAGFKMSGSIMKQPMFSWSTKDKYDELQKFKLEVHSML